MKKILFFISILFSLNATAQYYNAGQDRSGLEWKKIESLHFEVIYPNDFEYQAIRVMRMMEKSYQFTTQSLKHKPKKISIILHNETVKSNAFLGWAPSRIEMYATPHQNIYSQDWLEQLAIHEYRHMIQIAKLEDEMSKILRWLFGEQAAAMLAAAYMPFWFLEGDAVVAETALSLSGRGRLPDFHKEHKAQLVEKGKYSYDKAYLGSYKDHVANHYKLGYYMVGGAREKYDKVLWDEVISYIARKPFSLRALDKGLKKNIGINKVQLYDTIFDGLLRQWENEISTTQTSEYDVISSYSKHYTSYNYGFKNTDSTYVAYKTGVRNVGEFVEINTLGKERKLFTPGYSFNESITGKDSLIVWIERLSHPRWGHSDISLLRVFNINSARVSNYKFKTKLFAPSISPDNTKIIAVEGDNEYRFYLNVIDLKSGILDKRIAMGEDFVITPSWAKNENAAYAIILRDNQKGISKIDESNGKTEIIFPFDNQEISRPIEHDGSLYFIAGYSGTDEFYQYKNGRLYKLTQSKFGVAQPSIINNELIYSNYTSNGYQLVHCHLDSLSRKLYDKNNRKTYSIAQSTSKQEPGVIDFSAVDNVEYRPQKYSKASDLLNIHSWAPVSIDPYGQRAGLGFSVLGQNKLGTSDFVGGYQYSWTDEQGEWFAKYRYLGWYPVIELGTSTGKKESQYLQLTPYVNDNNELVRVDTITKEFGWKETNFSINTYLPLNFSKGKYFNRLQPRLNYQYTNIDEDNRAYSGFPGGVYQSLETGIYMYNILKSSPQDLLPNWGIIFDFTYVQSLSGQINLGQLAALSCVVYLPGLSGNHGVSIYNGVQTKSHTEQVFSDRLRYPRGHHAVLNKFMYSYGIDYRLPLLYPDINILGLTYIKRFNLKLFYDQAFYNGVIITEGIPKSFNGTLKSTGLELTSNLHLLRFIAPIEMGVRSSYLFDKGFNFDFLFSVNFSL